MINGISIRAPTRGATLHKVLNPQGMKFQSALPRGERRRTALRRSVRPRISIRAPTRGATKAAYSFRMYYFISIRAPTRGATRDRQRAGWKYIISIRAPTRGATGMPLKTVTGMSNFNPRSHEGSDINFHQKVLFSLSKNCLIHLFFITNFLN